MPSPRPAQVENLDLLCGAEGFPDRPENWQDSPRTHNLLIDRNVFDSSPHLPGQVEKERRVSGGTRIPQPRRGGFPELRNQPSSSPKNQKNKKLKTPQNQIAQWAIGSSLLFFLSSSERGGYPGQVLGNE